MARTVLDPWGSVASSAYRHWTKPSTSLDKPCQGNQGPGCPPWPLDEALEALRALRAPRVDRFRVGGAG